MRIVKKWESSLGSGLVSGAVGLVNHLCGLTRTATDGSKWKKVNKRACKFYEDVEDGGSGNANDNDVDKLEMRNRGR